MPKKPVQTQRPVADWWARTIALAGVLVALGSLCWQWQQGRRQLDVKLVWGRADFRGGAEQREGLHLAAANPGHRPVRVTKAGVYLPDGPPFPESSPYHVIPTGGNWEFPCYVDPDDNRVITLDGPHLAAFCEALISGGRSGEVTLVGFYVEGSDVESARPYRSKPCQLNVDEALKLARAQIERQEGPSAASVDRR